MPYFTLTGIENCLFQFCENNPNLIESYFWAIRRNGITEFQQGCAQWYKNDLIKQGN